MTIYLDAMGGDNAPVQIIEGAVAAVSEYGINVTLIGDEAVINNVFENRGLSRSGIDALRLLLDGAAVELPTDPGLQGPTYAALCAKGLVSGDYEYTVTADGIRVSVDGANYRLGEDGALLPAE